jgi:hypothetical protein
MPNKVDGVVAALRAPARFAPFDNQSGELAREISDLLCVYSTGATAGGRDHFTWVNVDLPLQGVAAISTIGSPIAAFDLASRAVEVTVSLTDREYVPERDLKPLNDDMLGGLVALLADAVSAELRNRARTYTGLSRMADFERGSRAAAEAWGSSDVEMAVLFKRSQATVQEAVVQANPLINVIVDYVRANSDTNFPVPLQPKTAGSWMEDFMRHWPHLRNRDSQFPQSVRDFGKAMKAAESVLKVAYGIIVKRPPRGDSRLIQFLAEPPAGASAEPPARVRPTEPCPACGNGEWWLARETKGQWWCRSCEPMPMVVNDLSLWPPPPGH